MGLFKNLIGGEWVEGGDTIRSINPSDTDDVVAECAVATAQQVADAAAAARIAQQQWAQTTTQVRSDLLLKVGTELMDRREELGELISREEGKTRPEGIGEMIRAAQVFRFFAGEVVRFALLFGLGFVIAVLRNCFLSC